MARTSSGFVFLYPLYTLENLPSPRTSPREYWDSTIYPVISNTYYIVVCLLLRLKTSSLRASKKWAKLGLYFVVVLNQRVLVSRIPIVMDGCILTITPSLSLKHATISGILLTSALYKNLHDIASPICLILIHTPFLSIKFHFSGIYYVYSSTST